MEPKTQIFHRGQHLKPTFSKRKTNFRRAIINKSRLPRRENKARSSLRAKKQAPRYEGTQAGGAKREIGTHEPHTLEG